MQERNVEILNSIKQVINNAIVTPGINVEKLSLFDIEFLFIRLRALSVSNIVTATYADNEEMDEYNKALEEWKYPAALVLAADASDNAKELAKTRVKAPPPVQPAPYVLEIDLNKVVVKWPENIVPQIKIPNNDIVVRMKYPDASLYTNQEFLSASGERLVEFLIQNSLESIEKGGNFWFPQDLSAAEVKEFLDELPIQVYDKIREFLSNLPHLFYELKYTNKNGTERKIVLDKLSDFFSF